MLFKTTRMDFADLYRFIQRITPANGLEAVLDVFEENNTVYAVMENPGGRPLQKWLEEHGTVTPQQACAMLEPVFNGVEAMHQVGLVHRGICPANIRIMDNGRARLTGYATVGLRTAGSGLHEQLYEGYSAPEQYSTAEFEGRYTDEYSLAAVFYRMVCGLSPVPAAQRLVSDSNPKARTVTPSVPAYVSKRCIWDSGSSRWSASRRCSSFSAPSRSGSMRRNCPAAWKRWTRPPPRRRSRKRPRRPSC